MNAYVQLRVSVAVFRPVLLDALGTLLFQPASMIGTCIVSSTAAQMLDARAHLAARRFQEQHTSYVPIV